jgi:hypothetical protein
MPVAPLLKGIEGFRGAEKSRFYENIPLNYPPIKIHGNYFIKNAK